MEENIFKKESLNFVAEFPCGLQAYSNGKYVAFFGEIEGELFKVSEWTRHPEKTFNEVAEMIYSRGKDQKYL